MRFAAILTSLAVCAGSLLPVGVEAARPTLPFTTYTPHTTHVLGRPHTRTVREYARSVRRLLGSSRRQFVRRLQTIEEMRDERTPEWSASVVKFQIDDAADQPDYWFRRRKHARHLYWDWQAGKEPVTQQGEGPAGQQ